MEDGWFPPRPSQAQTIASAQASSSSMWLMAKPTGMDSCIRITGTSFKTLPSSISRCHMDMDKDDWNLHRQFQGLVVLAAGAVPSCLGVM